MTISPDNKLTIAKVPFYCHLMEWGKFPIYLTLECINTFFAIIWFRHSDEYQWETIGYVIQTTARGRLSSFACTGEEPSFTLSPTLLLSLFPVQVSIRFVTSYQNGCATYGNDYAKPLKRLCRVLGTVVPLRWHSRAKGVAQACQRRGTSKAYLQRDSYQVVKLE